MKSEYDKQHIVSQSYLKHFSAPNKNNKGYHIGVKYSTFGKSTLFTKAISDVAYKKKYYDVPTRDDPKYWEHYFSKNIETLYGSPLENIIAKITLSTSGDKILNITEKEILSELISFQFARIPAFLDPHLKRGLELGEKMRESLLRAYGGILTPEQLIRITEMHLDVDLFKDFAFEAISNKEQLEKYSEILLQRVWTIYYNNSNIPFFTSDNPVLMYNFITNSVGYSDNGIARADTIIYFPISSKILVQLFPPWLLGKSANRINGSRICLSNRDIRFVIGTNSLQMFHATSETYMHPAFLEIVKRYNDK